MAAGYQEGRTPKASQSKLTWLVGVDRRVHVRKADGMEIVKPPRDLPVASLGIVEVGSLSLVGSIMYTRRWRSQASRLPESWKQHRHTQYTHAHAHAHRTTMRVRTGQG